MTVHLPDIGDAFVLLSIFAIPFLGYFGILFTYVHQNSDFRELLSIPTLAGLPSFESYARRIEDRASAAKADNSLFFMDGDVGRVVRTQLARHSLAECFVAFSMMSAAYISVGLFVALPIPPTDLVMSAYALAPFPDKSVDISTIRIDVYAGAMTALFWAYAGALAYAFGALTVRVNSRDSTPGHFYSLTSRLILACAVALAVHHADPQGSFVGSKAVLPAIYFFCGMFPQRILDWAWAQLAKRFAIEKPADPALRLSGIAGLEESQIERLGEIGIDSTHALALADPIRSFVRLPYRLSQIIDWTSQAMLHWAFGQDGAAKIRATGCGNILEARHFAHFDGGKGIDTMAKSLDVTPESLRSKWEQIESTQHFIRLRELADALARHERGEKATSI
jgi:hypothetical protein